MRLVYDLLLFLHFVGWAIVLGGYLATMRSPGLYRGVFHGILTALIAGTGALIVAQSSSDLPNPDLPKMLTKLALTLVIAVCAYFAKRQGDKGDNGTGPVRRELKQTIGALTLINLAVAVFWN